MEGPPVEREQLEDEDEDNRGGLIGWPGQPVASRSLRGGADESISQHQRARVQRQQVPSPFNQPRAEAGVREHGDGEHARERREHRTESRGSRGERQVQGPQRGDRGGRCSCRLEINPSSKS